MWHQWYREVEEIWRRAGTPPNLIRTLAEADVFASLGIDRREALWEARAITGDKPLPLFADDLDGEGIVEPSVHLPKMSEGEHVVEDYVSMRLTLRSHPIALLRSILTPEGKTPPKEVRGRGLIAVPQGRHPRDVNPMADRLEVDQNHFPVRSDQWTQDEKGCDSTLS